MTVNEKFMELGEALEIVLQLAQREFERVPSPVSGLALDTVEDFVTNNLEFDGERKYIIINAGKEKQ